MAGGVSVLDNMDGDVSVLGNRVDDVIEAGNVSKLVDASSDCE